jgi:Family of unknown function (DUF6497)
MRPCLAAVLIVSFAAQAAAEEKDTAVAIAVPSGQTVTLIETVQDAAGPSGLTWRFRFLAPAIARDGGSVDADEALDDMAFLCDSYALPRLPDMGPEVQQVVISLADREIPFGEPDPEATQYFEAFRPEDGVCVWEGF